jgi:DNA-binding transcriptional ArsR family regulator
MGITKTALFTSEENELAIVLKALGHPARIAIMNYLAKMNECICGDLVNELPLAQPTISQHLKELKNAGLIQGTIEGTSICYCINSDGFEKIRFFFERFNQHISLKKSTCC